jgi:hypothetical protein
MVTALDCENCLTERLASTICFRRGFVWGVPDEEEPRWEFTKSEAIDRNEDVSKYFNPTWEGNTHLKIQLKTGTKTIKTKQQIPLDIRWDVWERDDFTCQICGKRKHLSIDHIYPESKGGTLEISNLQTLCRLCNSIKGSK